MELLDTVGVQLSPDTAACNMGGGTRGPRFALLLPSDLSFDALAQAAAARSRVAALVRLSPQGNSPRLYDTGPFSLDELERASESPRPLQALAAGRLNGEDLVYGQIARRYGLPFVALDARHELARAYPLVPRSLAALRFARFRRRGSERTVFAPSFEQVSGLLKDLIASDSGQDLSLTTPRRLRRRLEASIATDTERSTTGHLAAIAPLMSAYRAPSPLQRVLVAAACAGVLPCLLFQHWTGAALLFLASVVTFVGLGFLRWQAFVDFRLRQPALPDLPDSELPSYSVMVALYREANMIGQLVAALAALDYPQDRLEIRILVEADDEATRLAAETAIQGRPHMQVSIVPDGLPRTKPRALAYGLAFCRGDIVTVFDAEDRPARDQLRLAAAALIQGPDHLACVQARLDIDHAHSFLQRQFLIEYASLFHGILPWLADHRMPMPLGGTSNHFKRHALDVSGGWDPYNVTEDADLGARLARFGYSVGVVESRTLENAPDRIGVWMRQRRRWIKGWLITWMVHMRDPVALIREMGLLNAVTFQFHMAATVVAPLAHLCWLGLIAGYASGYIDAPDDIDFTDTLLISGAAVGLSSGYVGSMLLAWHALRAVERTDLRRDILKMPLYWLLVSFAAWHALLDLMIRPHHWHKTPHDTITGTKDGNQHSHPD
ncbi:glycosyltransferase family 2 protein [Oryzibacter oryziterrae]|uniref:glycosyltransferase family 2 protein n=1 Tax=Oryzibacter oryziterrae TaxID=2766474 RepID=UPI001F26078B|nr:glycosyltransferase family 2 protein [Oryzibacter oryziterrae]